MGVMGKTSLPILIEEQPHLVECVVVDDCQPSLVLGMDFLLQRGAILDLSKGQMYLESQSVPLRHSQSPTLDANVCIEQSVRVPARSVRWVTLRSRRRGVGNDNVPGVLLVTPKAEDEGWHLPPAMLDFRDGLARAPVANTLVHIS